MKDRYMFRGKCETTGRWFFGSLSQTQSWDYKKEKALVPCIVHETDRGLLIKEVDPSTIGQCTGLKDKNGKLVFEGDIINCTRGCPHTVIWVEEHGGTYIGGMPTFYLSGLNNGYAWAGGEEVVGNIHDTPETEGE